MRTPTRTSASDVIVYDGAGLDNVVEHASATFDDHLVNGAVRRVQRLRFGDADDHVRACVRCRAHRLLLRTIDRMSPQVRERHRDGTASLPPSPVERVAHARSTAAVFEDAMIDTAGPDDAAGIVRRFAAECSDPRTLEDLAGHPAWKVRRAIAANPDTPFPAMVVLVEDDAEGVRQAALDALAHSGSPSEVLFAALADTVPAAEALALVATAIPDGTFSAPVVETPVVQDAGISL